MIIETYGVGVLDSGAVVAATGNDVTGGEPGVYLSPNASYGGLYAIMPFVVLDDSVYTDFHQDNLYASGLGGLNQSGQVVLEELIHAAIDAQGGQGGFLGLGGIKEGTDEAVAKGLVQVISNAFRLHKILSNPSFDPDNPTDRNRVLNILRQIQAIIDDLTNGIDPQTGQPYHEGDINWVLDFLKLLGLDDLDGNGISDLLERLLRKYFEPMPDWVWIGIRPPAGDATLPVGPGQPTPL